MCTTICYFLCRLSDANNTLALNKNQIEKQNRQLSDYEAELSLLRKRIEGLEVDRDRDRRTITALEESLNRARSVGAIKFFFVEWSSERCSLSNKDLDQETLMHVDAENRMQTLDEEMEFLKTIHEQVVVLICFCHSL